MVDSSSPKRSDGDRKYFSLLPPISCPSVTPTKPSCRASKTIRLHEEAFTTFTKYFSFLPPFFSDSTGQDVSNETLVPCFSNHSFTRGSTYYVFVAVFTLLLGPFVFFNVHKTKYLQFLTSVMRCAGEGSNPTRQVKSLGFAHLVLPVIRPNLTY